MRNKSIVIIGLLFLLALPSVFSVFKTTPVFEESFRVYNNHIIIAATIDNTRGNYMLDTGCPLIVTKNPIDDLPDADITLRNFFIHGAYSSYAVKKLEGFKINKTSILTPCAIIRSDTLVDDHYDGIIGLSAFRGYFLEISFSDKKIRLYKERPKNYIKHMPLTYEFGAYPIIQCTVDGDNAPFMVDTGADTNIIFPLPDAKTLSPDKYVQVLNTGDIPYYRVHASYFNAGFTSFQNITGYANTVSGLANYTVLFQKWGNIGFDFLKWYDFVFDLRGSPTALLYYKNAYPLMELTKQRGFSRWYLNGRPNTHFNSYGIDRWEIQSDTLVIAGVVSGWTAYTNKLVPGTRIKKVNNKAIKDYGKKELEKVLFFSEKPLLLSVMVDDYTTTDIMLGK